MTDYEKIAMAEVAVSGMIRTAKRNKQDLAVMNWEEVAKFLAELKQSYSQQPKPEFDREGAQKRVATKRAARLKGGAQ